MDRGTLSAITHGDLPLWNPLSKERLDEVIALLDLPAGARVLDVGCGTGEALVRIAERHGAGGRGIDVFPAAIEEARRRAGARGVEVEFVAADASSLEYEPGYDLAMTVGSSHALGGGPVEAVARLAELGSSVLIGEGFWAREPGPEYLEALGATRDELPDYAGMVRAGEEAGLVPLYATVATEEEWDRYEWRLILNGERWAAAHAGEPGAAEMREWVAQARSRLLLPGGRGTLGFGLFLFGRLAPAVDSA